MEWDKDKAEAIDRLAKAARGRFQFRSEIEWKICFAIWTAFGVSAGFVLASTSWKPTQWEAWIVLCFTLPVIGLYAWWTYKRHQFDTLDASTSYYWEWELLKLLGKNEDTDTEKAFPIRLRPPWGEEVVEKG